MLGTVGVQIPVKFMLGQKGGTPRSVSAEGHSMGQAGCLCPITVSCKCSVKQVLVIGPCPCFRLAHVSRRKWVRLPSREKVFSKLVDM